MEILERWVATEGEELIFPLLEYVYIEYCPRQTTLPEAPKLKVIDVEEDKTQLSLSIFESKHKSCLSDLWLSISDTEATQELELDKDPEVSLFTLMPKVSLSTLMYFGCSFLFRSSPLQPIVVGLEIFWSARGISDRQL